MLYNRGWYLNEYVIIIGMGTTQQKMNSEHGKFAIQTWRQRSLGVTNYVQVRDTLTSDNLVRMLQPSRLWSRHSDPVTYVRFVKITYHNVFRVYILTLWSVHGDESLHTTKRCNARICTLSDQWCQEEATSGTSKGIKDKTEKIEEAIGGGGWGPGGGVLSNYSSNTHS